MTVVEMRGNEAVAALLAERGLTTVFSMLGGTNVPWIGAGVDRGHLRLVPTRHEATSVSAAVGYARSTGRVGLCSVSRGPGFANAINALIAAAKNHSPLVLVVGESPSPDAMTAQNVEQRAFTELCGAGFHHGDTVTGFAAALDDAVAAARRNGQPQVVSMADAVLGETVVTLPPRPAAEVRAAGGQPDPADIDRAVELIARASRPVILAGQGAVHADCGELLGELADVTGARLTTSLLAVSLFDGHPANLGLSGGWAPAAAREELRTADLVLVVGASLNQFTFGHGKLYDGPTIIHCDVDPEAIGVHVEVELGVVGDARATADALLDECRRRLPDRSAPDAVSIEDVRESVLAVPLPSTTGIDPRDVYRRLDEVLPANRVIVTDSGRSLPTLPSLVRTSTARDFLVGRGYGSIGLGLGTAIGAAAARPDAHVVLCTGDGGLMMCAQELDSVRLAGLRLTVVVLNDLQYGAELKHLREFGLPDGIAQQAPPDLVRLAEVFGGTGTVIRDADDFGAIDWRAEGLQLLDVRIDPEVQGNQALGEPAEQRLRSTAAANTTPLPPG